MMFYKSQYLIKLPRELLYNSKNFKLSVSFKLLSLFKEFNFAYVKYSPIYNI